MQVRQLLPDVAPTDPCMAGIACKFVPALIEHLGVEVRPLVGGIEYVGGQLVVQALDGDCWVICGKSECDNHWGCWLFARCLNQSLGWSRGQDSCPYLLLYSVGEYGCL